MKHPYFKPEVSIYSLRSVENLTDDEYDGSTSPVGTETGVEPGDDSDLPILGG